MAQEDAQVYILPPTEAPVTGRPVTVDVIAEGVTNLYGAEIHLNFDPNAVRLEDSDPQQNGVQLTPGSLLDPAQGFVVANTSDNEAGTAIFAVTLVNPALPVSRRHPPDLEVLTKLIGPLVPGIGVPAFRIYRAAHSPEEETAETLRMVAVDPETVPEWARERLTNANRRRRSHDWAIPSFLEADRSIARYVLRPRRFTRLIHKINAPTLLVHGSEDRLVSVDSARWAAEQRPDWTYQEMEGVGHVPMLEAAERFADLVTGWLVSTT